MINYGQGSSLQHLLELFFLQRFQSPPLLSHTWPHPSACHLLAAILKVKLISRHQGLQLDSRALRAV